MTPRSRTTSTGVTTLLPTRSDRLLTAIFLRLTCELNHISSVFDRFNRQCVSVEIRGKLCNTFYLDVHCTVKAGSACWTR